MAWTISGIFSQTIVDIFLQSTTTTTQVDLDATNAMKIALYNNTITPDISIFQNTTRTAINYGSATFGTASSQAGNPQNADSTNWNAGGQNLTGVAVTNEAGAIVKFTATNTPSATSTTTMSSIYGGFIYLDLVTAPTADIGLCALYFGAGSPYSVTNGTFTVQYNASGIYQIDVA